MYVDFHESTKLLQDSEFRELVTAMCHYTENGITPEMSQATALVFSVLKVTLDRDRKKWEDICERNKVNGEKGGRPPKPK